MTASPTHLVLMPAFNPGPQLRETVAEALRYWRPVLVVSDGSTDGSEQAVRQLAAHQAGLEVLVLANNSGKGAAVLAGARHARERGFTHALVMDADGQHPAASIPEFMAASAARRDTLVLGRPVFPPNIPRERLHGRKLSVGLVRLELLGPAVADPLFGFRVYPLDPLLDELGPRRGGRRYDFDTEAAVRLCWRGVAPINLTAPVRYFSRAEGGVSHFRYLRDNATLVWMHTRLLAELLLRWPAILRHRRRWLAAGLAAGLALAALPRPAAAAEAEQARPPALPAVADDPVWSALAAAFAAQPDTTAGFVERRFFPFRRQPVELRGIVRVSATLGLSLHYTAPEDRIVILDDRGVLIRERGADRAPPGDARADPSAAALRDILRLDLRALAATHHVRGRHDGADWELELELKEPAAGRASGRSRVTGHGPVVRRIELRHSARQCIEIVIEPPAPPAAFTDEERRRFFR